MNLSEFLDHFCAPAYASDEDGRIVGWNTAAAGLLGHSADAVVGRQCHEVICGRDPSGNRYCRQDCNLREMVRQREPICSFRLHVQHASGKHLPVICSAVALCDESDCEAFQIVHVLYPEEVENKNGRLTDPGLKPAAEGDTQAQTRPAPSYSNVTLTRREAEVLKLMADGDNTNDIADSLTVSPHTVRNHVQNILHKLNSHTRLQAIVQAQEQNLI